MKAVSALWLLASPAIAQPFNDHDFSDVEPPTLTCSKEVGTLEMLVADKKAGNAPPVTGRLFARQGSGYATHVQEGTVALIQLMESKSEITETHSRMPPQAWPGVKPEPIHSTTRYPVIDNRRLGPIPFEADYKNKTSFENVALKMIAIGKEAALKICDENGAKQLRPMYTFAGTLKHDDERLAPFYSGFDTLFRYRGFRPSALAAH